ncbi:putative syntaxin binding protein [Trypanosoma cruzi]|uniref:Putative syntaxin binding protein n=1 Tax=Trypanosoma cruzi TaxID=5693 RepID=A0A2V2WCT8_TRYCR|nr:putative syntaxin binding protein [Trypanosoma cruzi]
MDEEDAYWRSYRHYFLARCVEELLVALKKLHAYNPGLGAGRRAEGQSCGVEQSGAGSAGASGEAGQTVAAHRHLREACGTVPGEATGGGVGSGAKHYRRARALYDKPQQRAAPGEGCRNAPASATAYSPVAFGCEQHRRVDGGQEAAADPRRRTDARRPFVCDPRASDEEGRERATIQHGVGAQRTENEYFRRQRREGRGSVSESGLHDYGDGEQEEDASGWAFVGVDSARSCDEAKWRELCPKQWSSRK